MLVNNCQALVRSVTSIMTMVLRTTNHARVLLAHVPPVCSSATACFLLQQPDMQGMKLYEAFKLT